MDHGYWVYRVARAVLPDVPIEVYPVWRNSVGSVTQTLLNASVRGVVVINMSLGLDSECQLVDSKEEELARDFRLALVQRESFLFVAEGNSRTSSHTWLSADANNNGLVDFRTTAEARRIQGSSVDGARVDLSKGDNFMYLSWDTKNHPEAEYAFELVAPNGKVLTSVERKGDNVDAQCLQLGYKAKNDTRALLRVRRLAGPKSGVLMRVQAYGEAYRADYNGVQSALAYTLRDNPFVVYVGAFGKTADGKLAPSPFSDIGIDTDGKIAPHVLGPGQLIIDGHEHDGTSFASPFLTALYATRVGYNIKNIVERTASFDRLAPGLLPYERSRWGIPDPDKVIANLTSITGPTTVENVSHEVKGDDLVIHYSMSRCCMQSLVWYAGVALLDGDTHKLLRDAAGNPIVAFQQLFTDQSGRVTYPVELHFPMKELAPYKGKPLDLYFGLRVRAWKSPPPGSLVVDQAPTYRITP